MLDELYQAGIYTSDFLIGKLEGDVQVVKRLDDARWKVYEVPRLRRSTVASRRIDCFIIDPKSPTRQTR